MIHADASSSGESAAGDINNFMEIEIDIVTKDVLTQQVKQAYDNMQEDLQTATDSSETGIDWGAVGKTALTCFLIGLVSGAAIAAAIAAPEILPALLSAIGGAVVTA